MNNCIVDEDCLPIVLKEEGVSSLKSILFDRTMINGRETAAGGTVVIVKVVLLQIKRNGTTRMFKMSG